MKLSVETAKDKIETAKTPESEFVRPYASASYSEYVPTSYSEMEYFLLPPTGQASQTPETAWDTPWAQPQDTEASKAFEDYYAPAVIKLEFVPAAGTYTSAQTVYIIPNPTDADIYYTTDGTEPTVNKTKYTIPLVLSSDTTLKARAFKDGWVASEIKTGVYDITTAAWASFMGPTYWTPTVGSWDGAKYTTSGGQVLLARTGTWYLNFRPTHVRVTHDYGPVDSGLLVNDWDGGDTGVLYSSGSIAATPYVSGTEGVLNFTSYDIYRLIMNEIGAGDLNITNIEFFS